MQAVSITYTITATNTAGDDTVTVDITVDSNIDPPTGILPNNIFVYSGTSAIEINVSFLELVTATAVPFTDFVISGAASNPQVSRVVEVSGLSALTLELSAPVLVGETITLSYTRTEISITDPSGAPIRNFVNRAVANRLTEDTTPAILLKDPETNIAGNSLEVVFNEPLYLGADVNLTDFTISGTTSTPTVTAVAQDMSRQKLIITLSPNLVFGDSGAKLSYARTMGSITDLSGNQIDNFERTILIRVPNEVRDTTPPTVSSVALGTNGNSLIVTYSEVVSFTGSSLKSDYAVTVQDGDATSERTVTQVSLNGDVVELTLSSPIASGTTVTLSYTQPRGRSGAVRAQDAAGNMMSDFVVTFEASMTETTVTPTFRNSVPLLSAIDMQHVNSLNLLEFTAIAIDTDADESGSLTYLLSAEPSGATINPTSGDFSWTPTTNQIGTHTFLVMVSDGTGTDSTTVTVLVGDGSPPTVVSSITDISGTTIEVAFSEAIVISDVRAADFMVSGSASPPVVTGLSVQQEVLSLVLSAAIAEGETITLSYTRTEGSIQDVAGNRLADFVNTAVTNQASSTNNPPTTVDSIDLVVLLTEDTLTIHVAASFTEGDAGDRLTYTANSSNNTVATVTATATDGIVTVNAISAGTTTISVTATDIGGLTATQTFMVIVHTDTSPSFGGVTVGNEQSIVDYTVGTEITLSLPAATGGNGTLTYTLTALPTTLSGLTFNANTRIISGIQNTVSGAQYTLTATDGDGDIATLEFFIRFNPTVPIITASTNTVTAIAGIAIEPVTIITSSVVSFYSIAPAIENGLLFDLATGTISGMPTAPAVSTTYTITAKNVTGTDTVTVDITVYATTQELYITVSAATVTAIVGTAITEITISSTGGTVASYSIAPAIENGLLFDLATGTISGTPTAPADLITYTIIATNAAGATDTVTVDITVNSTDLVPSFGSAPSGIVPLTYNVGTAVTLNLPVATGGNGTLSYTLTDILNLGLPAGLTFNSDANAISGTPTATAFLNLYTLTVTDDDGDTDTRLFSIIVHAAGETQLSFGTATISAQTYTVGTAVTLPLPSANGGNGTLTYALSPNLPAGLMFNGTTRVISGTPTATATRKIYLLVATDPDKDTDFLYFSLTVNSAIIPNNLFVSSGAFAIEINVFFPGPVTATNVPLTDFVISGAASRPQVIRVSEGSNLDFLSLELLAPVLVDEVITLSYTQTEISITNSSGEVLENFASLPVVNRLIEDTTPAMLLKDPETNIAGNSLEVFFNEPLYLGADVNLTDFTISGTTSTPTVTAVAQDMSRQKLIITLSPNLVFGDSGAELSYARTTSSITDLSGNQIEDFERTILIRVPEPQDMTPPTVSSVALGTDGNSLIVTYSEVVSFTGGLLRLDYTVTVQDGAVTSERTVTQVSLRGDVVELTLSSPIASGTTVTLSYTQPRGGSVPRAQDAAGNVMSDFVVAFEASTTQTVVTVLVGDGSPPTVVSGTTNITGSTIRVVFSKDIMVRNATAADFTVSGSTSSTVVTGLSVQQEVLSLVLSAAIAEGENITLSYTQTMGSIEDTAGNQLADFVDAAVTNTVSSINNVPTIVGSIDSVVLLTEDTITIHVASSFTEEDAGDSLTYTANSSDNTVATVTATDGIVTVNAISAGTTTISVIATDIGRLTATQTFMVTVHTDTSPSFGGVTVGNEQSIVDYTVGTQITLSLPAATGGNGTLTYTLTALPTTLSGLTFDANTLIISGIQNEVRGAQYTLTATDGDGDIATLEFFIRFNPTAPIITASTNTVTAIAGTAITDITITSSGGAVYFYSIAPAIANGLSFDIVTGTISGTPDAPAVSKTYTITATNVTGTNTGTNTVTDTVTVDITVNPSTPDITASTAAVTVIAGTAITEITISSTGGAVASYSIAPAIENGLSFDLATGTISGTPDVAADSITYTITATNVTGTDTVTVTIIVTSTPDITASTAAVTVIAGAEITEITISSTGGAVASYSIAPAIENGLSFDLATGTISGTPTAPADLITYTITATNVTGTDTVTVDITVNAAGSPPTTMIVTVDSNAITMKTSKPVILTNADNADFTVTSTLNGVVTTHTITNIGSGSIVLTVTPAIPLGATISVSYDPTQGSSTEAITDSEGNPMSPFTNVTSTLSNRDFKITNISISPNPTNGILNITVDEKAEYRLLNIRGQTLKTGVLAKGKSSISLSSFAKGIYLLNIKTSKGSFIEKVVRN